ncbi:MAG: hypothetical protein IPK71_22105 [Myxococcales bacterium]|nr:hypothetical protein [Myxococcales bacterium]
MRSIVRAAFLLLVVASLGCSRAEPPGPALEGASPSATPPPLPVGLGGAIPLVPSAPAPAPSGAPSGADAAASASPAPASPDDPGALPQTRDKPKAEGPAFEARAAALWDAIVNDAPERALPFFFPVKAYEQVKAIPRPESDWKHRLVSAYSRDIHALHKKLGDDAKDAKLVRLDVPSGGGRWVEPDEETNKLGYYRVYGSRLRYEVDGKERSFEVKSLISWRGEWYVVHLSGFK